MLDLGLPDSKGIETLLRVHEQVPTLPILVLTGLADQQMALAAIKNGAQDYMVKKARHQPQVRIHVLFHSPVFTIETTIRHVLVRDAAVASALALITAEIVPIKPWPNERDRERLLNKVRQLLEHCIRPEVDVLLPAQHCPEGDLLSVWPVLTTTGLAPFLPESISSSRAVPA